MSKTEQTPGPHVTILSPASRLRDVVIRNEQTGALWRARRAEIRKGQIHVHDLASDDFLPAPAQTFTINATDGGDRTRCFAGVVLDRERSRIPELVVFT